MEQVPIITNKGWPLWDQKAQQNGLAKLQFTVLQILVNPTFAENKILKDKCNVSASTWQDIGGKNFFGVQVA